MKYIKKFNNEKINELLNQDAKDLISHFAPFKLTGEQDWDYFTVLGEFNDGTISKDEAIRQIIDIIGKDKYYDVINGKAPIEKKPIDVSVELDDDSIAYISIESPERFWIKSILSPSGKRYYRATPEQFKEIRGKITHKVYKMDESLNEGILNFFKKAFAKVGKMYHNIKGGKKLQEILDKYKVQIDSIFSKLLASKQTDNAASLNNEPEPAKPKNSNTNNNTNTEQNVVQTTEAQDTSQDTHDLDRADIKTIIKNQKQRIEVLKTRFNKEVDMLIKHMRDNGKSDKLEKLTFLTKSQFEDYVYEKEEELIRKSNDKASLKNIIKLRNTLKQKMIQEIKDINAEVSVNAEQDIHNVDVNYSYLYTNTDNKRNIVKVIEIDKDVHGQANNKLAKVIDGKQNSFYVLKSKLVRIKKGDVFTYTNKEGETNKVTVTKVLDDGTVAGVHNPTTDNEFNPIDANLS